MDTNTNLLGVLKTIYKKRFYIVYTCLGVGILTAAVSLLLPNYYKATTTFLAGSPDQANPKLLFEEGTREANYYGTGNDIDRILTIAKSSELLDFLIDSFELYKHYDINPDLPKAPFRVREELLSYYEITKTNRDAIELSIEDVNREMAAQMTNAARERIDEIVQRLVKNTQEKALKTYSKSIEALENKIAYLSDTLIILREKYGIYNTVSQGNELTSKLSATENNLALTGARLRVLEKSRGVKRDTITKLRSIMAGLETQKDTLKAKLQRFNVGMPKVNTISLLYFEANERVTKQKQKYEQLQNAYRSDIPATILVETAALPIVKDRPKRSILVLGAVFLAFLFSVVGVLLFEQYKGVDWKKVLSE